MTVALRDEVAAALALLRAGAGERALQQAYELGRRALAEGAGLIAVDAAYQDVAREAQAAAATLDEARGVMARLDELRRETLTSFEMALRGYRDANDALRAVNVRLAARTRELAEAQSFLNGVLESSTEYSIVAVDLARRVLLWNEGARRQYGYEAGEVIGRASDVLHDPEDLTSGLSEALYQRALEAGMAEGVLQGQRKDGSRFTAKVVVTRRADADGQPIGFAMITRDVTQEQRHLSERQVLAEVGAVLAATLDYDQTLASVAELAVRAQAECCVVDVPASDGTARRLEVAHAEGAPHAARAAAGLRRLLLAPDTRPGFVVASQRTLTPALLADADAAADADGDADGAPSDGASRDALRALGLRSAMAVPLVAGGSALGVLVLGSTREGRRYGPADVHFAEELARRAALAVANALLYDRAQRALRARDEVLGIVAHDLRNPLNAIKLYASVLQRMVVHNAVLAAVREPAEAIQRAGQRANRLIRDLLEIQRIESGRLAVAPERVAPARVLRELGESQRPLVAAAELELTIDAADELPEVWADGNRLIQALENLIGNALKFTPAGGRITVGATRERGGDEVWFRVSDTGPGVQPEDLPHLFDRFWQGNREDRRGVGLGLSICKEIAAAHAGRIWAESEPGRGASFVLAIPVEPPRADDAQRRGCADDARVARGPGR